MATQREWPTRVMRIAAGAADEAGMTSVHGFCADCGDVEVPLSALAVDAPTSEHAGSYVFPCPSCASLVREPAGPHLAEVLVAFGAHRAGAGDPDGAALAHGSGPARVHFFAA